MTRGLGQISRARLGAVIRRGAPVITPALAAETLSLSAQQAAHLLARWARAGWLARIRRGVYIPLPLHATRADAVLEDPWVVASALFDPCYIAGWSAAEHWGLTEQIFRSICVLTLARPRKRQPVLGGAQFNVQTTRERQFFGLKTIWRGTTRVRISDPAKTIVDMLNEPQLGGGIRSVADMLAVFLKEHSRAAPDLVNYAGRLGNGAVFKRLGFLLERQANGRDELIAHCRKQLTSGYSQFDPALPGKQLVTAWRLWVPRGWTRSSAHGRKR